MYQVSVLLHVTDCFQFLEGRQNILGDSSSCCFSEAWLVVMRIKKSATSNENQILITIRPPPPRSIATKDFVFYFETEQKTWESFSGVKTSPSSGFKSYDTNIYRAQNQKGFADEKTQEPLKPLEKSPLWWRKRKRSEHAWKLRAWPYNLHCVAITTTFRLLFNCRHCLAMTTASEALGNVI